MPEQQFDTVLEKAKKCVYVIFSVRWDEERKTHRYTVVGNGFLAGKKRLVGLSTYLVSEYDNLRQNDEAIKSYEASTKYIFQLQNDTDMHRSGYMQFQRGKDLFLDSEQGIVVFHLPDEFYTNENGDQIQSEDHYLSFASQNPTFGDEVYVLAYPFAGRSLLNNTEGFPFWRFSLVPYSARFYQYDTRGKGELMLECDVTVGAIGAPIINCGSGEVVGIFDVGIAELIGYKVVYEYSDTGKPKRKEDDAYDKLRITGFGIPSKKILEQGLHETHNLSFV